MGTTTSLVFFTSPPRCRQEQTIHTLQCHPIRRLHTTPSGQQVGRLRHAVTIFKTQHSLHWAFFTPEGDFTQTLRIQPEPYHIILDQPWRRASTVFANNHSKPLSQTLSSSLGLLHPPGRDFTQTPRPW